MNITDAIANFVGGGGERDEPQTDALDLIHRDHEEVEKLFSEALGDGPSRDRRKAIDSVLKLLDVHTRMEEKIFYPALYKAGKGEERDSVLEAREEHAACKDLIKKIRRLPARDETLKAKLTVLHEFVQHHVKEEESEMFGEARKTLGDELRELGEKMARFKDKELGVKSSRSPKTRKATARRERPGTTAAEAREPDAPGESESAETTSRPKRRARKASRDATSTRASKTTGKKRRAKR